MGQGRAVDGKFEIQDVEVNDIMYHKGETREHRRRQPSGDSTSRAAAEPSPAGSHFLKSVLLGSTYSPGGRGTWSEPLAGIRGSGTPILPWPLVRVPPSLHTVLVSHSKGHHQDSKTNDNLLNGRTHSPTIHLISS